jgi:DNA-binding response OmpR family regulator
MPANTTAILLCGLDDTLAAELSEVLTRHRVTRVSVRDTEGLLDRLLQFRPDVLFCSSERRVFDAVIGAVRTLGLSIPVIAVSRTPDVAEWLDAMDSGAADYCGAPFEFRSVDWILQSNLRRGAAAFAVA